MICGSNEDCSCPDTWKAFCKYRVPSVSGLGSSVEMFARARSNGRLLLAVRQQYQLVQKLWMPHRKFFNKI